MVGGRDFFARLRRLYLPLAVFVVLGLFPFYWMLITSIKPEPRAVQPEDHAAGRPPATLEALRRPADRDELLTWTYNTMLVAVVTTVISVVLGTMIAYPLARLRFPGAAWWRSAWPRRTWCRSPCCSSRWPTSSTGSSWATR